MRVLAIESSGTAGSLAALAAGELRGHVLLDPKLRSARTLAPGIRELLAEVGWRPQQVELVAVARGPGSFTGLRLGVMTAKAFAYAAGAPILGVNTLATIAARVPADDIARSGGRIASAIDALRGEVYAAQFARDADGGLVQVESTAILAVDDWVAQLPERAVVTGPALEKLAARLPAQMRTADRELWAPDAATVARLAIERYMRGERDDVWRLEPLYLRRSAAEEKADAAQARSSTC